MFLVIQNIDPPPPLRPASVYPPPLLGREDTLAGRRGGGGSIFWKTRDIGLPSYRNNLSTRVPVVPYFLAWRVKKDENIKFYSTSFQIGLSKPHAQEVVLHILSNIQGIRHWEMIMVEDTVKQRDKCILFSVVFTPPTSSHQGSVWALPVISVEGGHTELWFKGAQVWDYRSLGFPWFLHYKAFLDRWLWG